MKRKFSIDFSETYSSEDYRLLSVSDGELLKYIENENELRFKGDAPSSAVLCTDKRTFSVRKAETTNLLAFAERRVPSVDQYSILTTPTYYLELSCESRGKEELMRIMSDHTVSCSAELKDDDRGISFKELLRRVPCSEKELQTLLREIMAIEGSTGWLVLSHEWIEESLSLILSSLLEHNMNFDSIAVHTLATSLQTTLPEKVLLHILSSFSTAPTATLEEDGSLDASKICRFLAKRMLVAEDTWVKRDFLETLKNALHDLAEFKEEYIRDVCVTIPGTPEQLVKRCIVEDLPATPKERFRYLFSIKAQYKHSEISPFLFGIQSADSSEKLLMKYAKRGKIQMPDGSTERVYTERP